MLSSRAIVFAAVVVAGAMAQERPSATPKTGAEELVERVRTGGVMGTDFRLTAIGGDAGRLDVALDAAIVELRRVEDLMTDWRASPLTTLNLAAGKGPVKLPVELAAIIGRGKALGTLTDGAFDITFAGVGRLWTFKGVAPRVPSGSEVAEALQHVDYRRVRIDEQRSTVAIPSGFRIGLGGIAKGYGIDRAMAVMRGRGVVSGVVSVGGDMKVLGQKAGKAWEIGVVHPRDKGRALAALRVSNTCVVTSGDYERFFEVDGTRYHHILDPRTGFPSKGCITATVVAANAEYADALATALCVLGPERGLALVEKLPRVEAIVVGLDGEVAASTGLRSSLVGESKR